MGMKTVKWLRIFIFFVVNNIILLLGAVTFMYIEYKYTAFADHRNVTELKSALEDIMGVPLNESTFQRVLANIDDYVRSDKECKLERMTQDGKKYWMAVPFSDGATSLTLLSQR